MKEHSALILTWACWCSNKCSRSWLPSSLTGVPSDVELALQAISFLTKFTLVLLRFSLNQMIFILMLASWQNGESFVMKCLCKETSVELAVFQCTFDNGTCDISPTLQEVHLGLKREVKVVISEGIHMSSWLSQLSASCLRGFIKGLYSLLGL